MATAETPKRSFKRTVASTVEGRTPRFLLGSLALAMVISLVAGLGIGVQIGEHDDNTVTPVTTVKPKPKPKPVANTSAFARPPVLGTVVRTTPRLLVVKRGTRRVSMTLALGTRIDLVRDASRSDIKVGSRVLFVLDPKKLTPPTTSGDTTTSGETTTTGVVTTVKGAKSATLYAKDVLIITGAAKIGSRVAAVTADSMTFRARNGTTVTISTAGATISKTIPGTRAKLLPGRQVLTKSVLPAAQPAKKRNAKAKAVKRLPVAQEIVVLPDGSPFG